MKIISWNTNGVRSTIKNNDFAWLKNYNPDILALQEIKAYENQIIDDLKGLDFDEITINSAKKAGYSGVATLSKVKTNFSFSNFFEDDEGRVLEHKIGNIIFFNIYFPNGQKNNDRLKFKLKFYDKFLIYVKKLLNQNFDIIVCGDFNTAHQEIDLKNPKSNANTSGFLKIERDWIDKFIETGFVDTFRFIHGDMVKYSWWSYKFNARKNNTGWRIDYFFISRSLIPKLKDAFILDNIFGSDHCPIGIELKQILL